MTKQLSTGLAITEQVESKSVGQFSAKFQIHVRKYGLTDSESLAVFIDNDSAKVNAYFQSKAEYDKEKESGNEKLKGIKLLVLLYSYK